MKKRIFTLLFPVICTYMCFAQNTINGTITYSTDNTPVEYANVVLLSQKDSVFITGAISDTNGGFVLNIPEQASTPYLIRITCIGYKTICQPVQMGNTGNIALEDDTQMLGEIVVKGNLPVTRLKGNAMVTNIEGSILSKVGTAQSVLDYLPGISSQKGSLQVLGRGTPVVYINGRLVRDISELDQLSSNNIRHIEVIHNPGARYDASVKAVIRIQTKKAVGEGIGFSSRTYIEYDDKYWDALNQLNMNYRQGGLDIFGMLFLYQNKDWQKFTLQQDSYLDKHWRQAFKADGRNKSQNIIADFGMNYVLGSSHSMGFKYRYDRYPKGNYSGNYEVDITENGSLYENTSSFNSTNGQTTQNSLNLYYNGEVKEWKIDFNMDLLWIDELEDQYANEKTNSVANSVVERTVTTSNEIFNRLYASKLVLSRLILGGELAFGGEFSHTNRNTDYRNQQGILEDNASEIKESNTAAFAEFSRELGKFQLQAGLRYEHVTFDYYQEKVFQDEQSKKYDNFFPSLSVATALGNIQMQLGYTQDISRPGFHSLRSNVYYANHYTYETGNPFLRPSISHSISLMGVYKWWQFMASYQRKEKDMMLTTTSYSEDNPNIVLFMPVNAPSYNMAYIQLNAAPTIGWWSPRFALSVQKQWFEIETYQGKKDLNRPKFYFRWQNSIKLPKNFLFSLNGYWQSKYDAMNTHYNKASWAIDTSLYKAFLNNRLSFQLNGYDIFLTRRRSRISYEGEIYTTQKNETPNTRSVSLTVRYRFNQGKNKYKGTGAGESQKSRL